MKKFRLLMHVEDIYLDFENEKKRMGYYQTFNVEAETEKEAELKAVEMVRNDEEIRSIWVKEMQKKPPGIYAEEINEIEEFDNDLKNNRTGKAFYYAKKWWQFWK